MGNCLRLGIAKIGVAWSKRRMKTSNQTNSISLLILGTQAVGKTTIALRLWKFKRTLPDLNYVQTKGFNTYSIRRKNKSSINLYDLGGHPSIQELWDHYYADAHGLIFVVDVSNQASLVEAGIVFSNLVNDVRIRGKPILLLANKQDLGGASEIELDNVMNLHEVVNAARCLTRLDESAAADLKNDKGIFDGFRWLVSYIENHYHELNDRVLHDTLEEKNREKARRSAIKEQMDKTPTTSINHSDRPSSQKSLVSKTFVREESTIDLQQANQNENLGDILLRPSLLESTLKIDPIPSISTTTNYLIKSRPNSSLGESNNQLFQQRKVSTAPSTKRRSLPILHPLSGKPDLTFDRFFLNSTPTGGANKVDPFVVNGDICDPPEHSPPGSATNTMTMSGRLSPDGADSDEGIINPAFDDETENLQTSSTDAQNITKMPNETTVSPIASVNLGSFSSPEKFRKLIRTESSDTERAGEILMVTTLAQVHQDHISNGSMGRRGSSTSTHESVALSLSSLKSEDANVMEGWKDEDVSQSRRHSRDMKRVTPIMFPPSNSQPAAGVHVFRASDNVEKDKETKSGLMRLGKAKAKTPLPPMGMVILTSQSSPLDNYVPKLQRAPLSSASSRNRVVPLNSRKSRENVLNDVGQNKLKKRTLSGFSESPETNSTSQFVKRPPPPPPPRS